ncbi:MAG: type VI secretion system tube protein TssD [Ginsengibacter sp.]
MALNSYLKITGEKQGGIKGSVTQKGQQGKIMVIAFTHEILSPRDPATGQATGKRVHKPFTITKEIDMSSPLLYAALVNNENLTTWELKCFGSSPKGGEVNNYTVQLSNAKIADIKSMLLNSKLAENMKFPIMEEISFIYEKIEWTWVDGEIIAEDYWTSPIV